MASIRLACPSYSRYLGVDENGKLVGPVAKTFKDSFYFLFQKFNVSIIPYSAYNLGCDLFGCPSFLQNQVDFDATLFSLKTLPTNITAGPVGSDVTCYLLTWMNRDDQVNQFTDTLDSVETSAGIGHLLFMAIFLIMLWYTSRRNFFTSLWNFVGFIFRDQQRIKSEIGTRMLVFVTIGSLFMLENVFLSTVRVGLVQKTGACIVNSIPDIKPCNKDLTAINFLACIQLTIARGHKISDPLRLAEMSMEEWSDELRRRVGPTTFLGERGEIGMIEEASCMFTSEEEMNFHFYQSPTPAITVPQSYFLSLLTPIEIRKMIIVRLYARFELGTYQKSSIHTPQLIRDIVGHGAELRCLDKIHAEDSIKLAPLSMVYFLKPIIFCLVSILITLFVFVSEIYAGNFSKNSGEKKLSRLTWFPFIGGQKTITRMKQIEKREKYSLKINQLQSDTK